MRFDRFDLLLEHAETIDESRFNMDFWYGPAHGAGCMMYHACQIPEFRKAGLRFEFEMPFYRRINGYEATAAFFQISAEDVERLFWGESYRLDGIEPTLRNVVARIREYVLVRRAAKRLIRGGIKKAARKVKNGTA